MAGFLNTLKRIVCGPPAVRVRPIRSGEFSLRSIDGATIPDGRLKVEADGRPLYEVKRWVPDGNLLRGAYRLKNQISYAGEIDVTDPARPQFFVINPPKTVFSGSHAACFRKRGNGRYYIHMGVSPSNIDAGLVAVEKLLTEAVRKERGYR